MRTKKIIPQKASYLFTNNIFQSDQVEKKFHKRPLAHDYEQRIHSEKPHMIRMIKCKANDSQINNIFMNDAPTEKERSHVKFTVTIVLLKVTFRLIMVSHRLNICE